VTCSFEDKKVPEEGSSADQQSSSLGDAARRVRAEKAEQTTKTAAPDWAAGPAQASFFPTYRSKRSKA
jgi:hypothetical protein